MSRGPTNGLSSTARRLSPTARLLMGAAATLVLFQLFMFSGFHGRSSASAMQLAQHSALEQRLAALQDDNAQLRTMYKHLESQLSMASAELGSRGLISEHARKELLQHAMPQPRKQGAVFPAGNEHRGCVAGAADLTGVVAAVVMVTFNRPSYLQKATGSLLSVHRRDPANARKFPLYISQDGGHKRVRDLALSLAPRIKYLQHIEDAPPRRQTTEERLVYYRIANHYKFIMQQLFGCRRYERLIIVEDDMLFAPDFFPYFEATSKILDQDKSLLCVSSWNDHGQKPFASDPERVERSDFFPGLGWMLRRETWDSLADRWPPAYWDDWMRRGDVRRGRQCLRPEVCRTYNFGERGSSAGQFYYRYLVPIRLNTVDVPWAKKDLSRLRFDAYDADFNRSLAAAQMIGNLDELDDAKGAVKVLYHSQKEYEGITGRLRMLREWKDGVPRGGYRGTVQVSLRGGEVRLYIAPAPGFKWVKPEGETVVDRTGAIKQVIRRRPPLSQRSGGKASSSRSSWWPWASKQEPVATQRRSGYRDGGSSGELSRLDELWGQWQEEEEARRQGFEDYDLT